MAKLTFKQKGNIVYVYINNRLFSEMLIEEFRNYKSYELYLAIHALLITKETSDCVNMDGDVVIYTKNYPACGIGKIIILDVGSKTITIEFGKLGKNLAYCTVIENIINTMHTMGYEKLYTVKSFRNLWGLLS